MGSTESEFTSSGEYQRGQSTDPTNWDNQSSDPDLSEILDQVIDFVPDDRAGNYSDWNVNHFFLIFDRDWYIITLQLL